MALTLNWGVAGTGMIAQDFLTALKTLPHEQHKLIALAGKDLDKTHHLATLHKVAIAYEGFEALANDPSIDIVYVSVLNFQHYNVAKLMLENGKHVLCEKPMCMTHKQTKSLIELARQKKLFLMEGMWSRFFPVYDALQKEISSGVLGDVYQVNVQFGVQINEIERNLMKDLGGGVVLDLGSYMLQFAQFVFKDEPEDILCGGHKNKIGVDESMACVLTYAGGKMASLTAHTRVALNNNAEIIGTKGTVVLDQFWCPTQLQTPETEKEFALPDGKYRFNFLNSAGLSYQAQECWNCLDQGLLESPKMTLKESLLLSKLQDTLRTQLGVDVEE